MRNDKEDTEGAGQVCHVRQGRESPSGPAAVRSSLPSKAPARRAQQVETTDSLEEARADTDKNVAPPRNVARNSGSVKGGCRKPWDIHDVKHIHAEEEAAGSHGT